MDIGETNQLWHKAHDWSSDYWLQDVLDKRVNDYEDTKKPKGNKNRFRDLKPLPETLMTNLHNKPAWPSGTEIGMATLDVDIPTTKQKDSASDPKEIMEEDNEAENGVIGDDRDEDKTVAETGPPTMAQPTDHPTPRLETGIVQQNIKRKEQKTLDDIDLDDIDNWLDNQTAIEYKPSNKSNHIENILDLKSY